MGVEADDGETPLRAFEHNGHSPVIARENRQVYQVFHRKAHTTATCCELVELEYLAHLVHMAQAHARLLGPLHEPAVAIEARAGDGHVVARDVGETQRVTTDQRALLVDPEVLAAPIELTCLHALGHPPHKQRQAAIPFLQSTHDRLVRRLPILEVDVGVPLVEALKKLRTERAEHAQ